MSKKTDQFGQVRHPGKTYRAFKGCGLKWHKVQLEFKRKKRLRRISRLARKGKRPRRTMRPVL